MRPANLEGEELRDVVIWLCALSYAKKQGLDLAFISDDGAFKDSEGKLHPELQAEIAANEVKFHFYPTIQDFIKNNSPVRLESSEEFALEMLPAQEVQRLVGAKIRQLSWTHQIRRIVNRDIEFRRGATYETGADSKFTELEFLLSMTLETEKSPTWLLFKRVSDLMRERYYGEPLEFGPEIAKASQLDLSALPDKQEKLIELDVLAHLSARIVSGKAAGFEVDDVALVNSSDRSFLPE